MSLFVLVIVTVVYLILVMLILKHLKRNKGKVLIAINALYFSIIFYCFDYFK